MTSAMNFALPRGGRFNKHRSKSFIDEVHAEEIEKVGPGEYDPKHPNLDFPSEWSKHLITAKASNDHGRTLTNIFPVLLHAHATHTQHTNTGGGRFNISNPKSDIDWLVYEGKQRPGPADYDPLPLPSDGGIISRAKPKSSAPSLTRL